MKKLEDEKSKEEEGMYSTEIPEASQGQYMINNVTIEAMIQIMAESNNLRQLVWSDELSGFLRNLNRYNSGSEVEMILSIFSSQTILVNRKTNKEKVMIKNAFACV